MYSEPCCNVSPKRAQLNLYPKHPWRLKMIDYSVLDIDDRAFANESDVEAAFVGPLLQKVFEYTQLEIRTKDYLAPTELDKGAGKIRGYYPDYAIYLRALPAIVIEVKDPSVPSEEGYREARLYATELNSRFPPDINPVSHIVATNGRSIIVSEWDSNRPILNEFISNLRLGSEVLDRLVSVLHRANQLERIDELLKLLRPEGRSRPLRLLGGPGRQNQTINNNTFSERLVPLLRRYFDPDETESSQEVVERGYVSSEEITKYNAELEALLKSRLSIGEDTVSVRTSKNHAERFDRVLNDAVGGDASTSDPMIIVLGGVGAGKSIFLRRYFSHLIPDTLRVSAVTITVDFNKADSELKDIDSWICEAFIKKYEEMFGSDAFSYDNLLKYFSPRIASWSAGPKKRLKDLNPEAFELQLSDKLDEWFGNPIILCEGLVRFHAKDKNQPVIVLFDNVDRRDRDQQLKIFQTVQWFRGKNKCISIISLRDETYDAYRNEPPLDAFLKPFTFRIIPPRFNNVIKKRLELAFEHLARETPDKNLTYETSSGFKISYPSDEVGQYLMAIYLSVFDQERKIRPVLEAISGRNVRNALEMFASLLLSGYFTDDLIFKLTTRNKSSRGVPEFLIIRVLMRTNFRYYSSDRGYLKNIFECPETSTASNFLLPEILEYLTSRRKKRTDFGIEGYVLAQTIVSDIVSVGYSESDVDWALEYLLRNALISADHQRDKDVERSDYLRITASGHYHIRFFPSRMEYLANVAIDTPLISNDAAKELTRFVEDSVSNSKERVDILRASLRADLRSFATVSLNYESISAVSDRILDEADELLVGSHLEKPAD